MDNNNFFHIPQALQNLFRGVIPQQPQTQNSSQQEPQHQVDDLSDMPDLEPVSSVDSTTAWRQGSNTAVAPVNTSDVDMDNNDDESMPDLESVSDSSEDSNDSSMDADEVEMQAVEDNNDSAWEDEDDHDSDEHHAARLLQTFNILPLLDEPEMPSLEPLELPTTPTTRNNRRARVDDDDDEVRDRRHPSQRTSHVNIDTTDNSNPQPIPFIQPDTQPPPPRIPAPFNIPLFVRTGSGAGLEHQQTPAQGDAFRLFQHFFPLGTPLHRPPNRNAAASARNNDDPNSPPPTNPQAQEPPPPPRFPIFGGVTMTFDIGGGAPPFTVTTNTVDAETPAQGHAPQGQDNEHGIPFPHFNFGPTGPGVRGAGPAGPRPGNTPDFTMFAQLMAQFGMLGQAFGVGREEPEDPDRAKRLVDGLEEVPVGLVRRLEHVGNVGGGEDSGGVLGDSGCAICWDKLLDGDGEGFGQGGEAQSDRSQTSANAPMDSAEAAAPPTSTSLSSPELQSKHTHSKIVSLPCAHVFHASCLIPWFSRPKQTTCPTCRFNIDPERLTYVRRRLTPHVNPDSAAETPAQDGQTGVAPVPHAGGTPGQGDSRERAETALLNAVDVAFNGSPRPQPVPDITFTVIEDTANRENEGSPVVVDQEQQQEQEQEQEQVMNVELEDAWFPIPIQNSQAENNASEEARAPSLDDDSVPIRNNGRPSAEDIETATLSPNSNPIANNNTQPQPQNRGGFVTFGFDIVFPPVEIDGEGEGDDAAGGDWEPGFGQWFTGPATPANGNPLDPPPAGGDAPPPGVAINMNEFFTMGGPVPVPGMPDLSRLFGNSQAVPNGGPTGQPPVSTGPRDVHVAHVIGGFGPHPPDGTRPPGVGFQFPHPHRPPGQRPQQAHLRREKKVWALPPAPGPTLRQRVERKEREAGLRCYDVSCGLGPSDEEPFASVSGGFARQVLIRPLKDASIKAGTSVCSHTFHPSCLVSAERVAMQGAEEKVIGDEVEVSCSVCRTVGYVSKEDWEEGVQTLA